MILQRGASPTTDGAPLAICSQLTTCRILASDSSRASSECTRSTG